MTATHPRVTHPSAKCWIDEHTNTAWFRADVTDAEARELERIMRQAFDAGLKHGYQQGHKRALQTQS